MRLIDADAIDYRNDKLHNVSTDFIEGVVYMHERIADTPTIEPRTKVVAQITFDEEKLREIVKEAVERFKEEYEITDRSQGKWIYGEHDVAMCDGYRCDKCGFFVPWDYKHKFIDFINDYHFCPNCGARMKGADDDEI